MGNNFRESKLKIAEKFEIPIEVVEDISKISIIGDEEITIENHKGILSFTDREIIINTSLGKIMVKGINFEISYLSQSTITIKGSFSSFKVERSDVDD